MASELTFKKWLEKVNERLTFFLLGIKEHKDMIEQNREMLDMLHRDWYYGEYPIYVHENAFIKKDETAVEQILFGQNVTSDGDGTEVEKVSETKTKKK